MPFDKSSAWGNGYSAQAMDFMTPDNMQLPPGKILIQVIGEAKTERKTEGGIIIPDTAVGEAPSTGEVVKVGPGPIKEWLLAEDEETGEKLTYALPVLGIPAVSVGQIVMFAQHTGAVVKFTNSPEAGAEYRIIDGWGDPLAIYDAPEPTEEESADGADSSSPAVGSGIDSSVGDDRADDIVREGDPSPA